GISWLARYSETLSRREQSAMARVGFWRAARHLVFPDEAILLPNGQKDPLRSWRFLVGYGPESVQGVLAQRTSDWATGRVRESRLHNLSWDFLFSGGALNLGAYLWLLGALFLNGYKFLGIVGPRAGVRTFWYLLIAATFIGGIGLSALLGSAFLGLGLQAGCAARLL